MKREISQVRAFLAITLFGLIFVAFSIPARAEVIGRVCVDTSYQTGTVTLAASAAAGDVTIQVNGYVPPLVSLIINPGTSTEEIVPYINRRIDGSNPYTLSPHNEFNLALNSSVFGSSPSSRKLVYAHAAGEPVRFEGYSGLAYFGYDNKSSSSVTIPKGILTRNYFAPGPSTNTIQPTIFSPGINDIVFSLPFGGKASDILIWFIDGSMAEARNNAGRGCGTITYQGRLTDNSISANGQYDLRFTIFDALTGGAAQSGGTTVENVSVVNGVFTVQLNFGTSFTNKPNARFMEIGVRAGDSTGAFTLLTPRQPLSSVPFAVNAQSANSILGGTIQLPLTTNAPATSECSDSTRGLMKADAINNRLYICTTTGWKSTLLQ